MTRRAGDKDNFPDGSLVGTAAGHARHGLRRNPGALDLTPEHTVGDALDALAAQLRRDKLIDCYFYVRRPGDLGEETQTGPSEAERIRALPWKFYGQTRGIASYATTSSGGEHHFLWLKFLPESGLAMCDPLVDRGFELANGKTKLGLAHAWRIAARCAELLDA
jgi:hypothetical protein